MFTPAATTMAPTTPVMSTQSQTTPFPAPTGSFVADKFAAPTGRWQRPSVVKRNQDLHSSVPFMQHIYAVSRLKHACNSIRRRRRFSLNTNNSAKILTGRYTQIKTTLKRKVMVRSSFVLRTHNKHVNDQTSNYPRFDVVAGGSTETSTFDT